MNNKSERITLILGGVSSGKSIYAENMITELHDRFENLYYFTPAETPRDQDMTAKVEAHKARRPDWLKTVECGPEPVKHASQIEEGCCVLFDSIGTLLGTMMFNDLDKASESAESELRDFIAVCNERSIRLILVTEEVGMTLVPMSSQGRQFQKTMGLLNQLAASLADEVFLIAAGLPLKLK